MFLRLTQTRFSDCCGGSAAIVYDTDHDKTYCLHCWGEKLHREHPDFVIKNEQKIKTMDIARGEIKRWNWTCLPNLHKKLKL
jgi:hypothetical protein